MVPPAPRDSVLLRLLETSRPVRVFVALSAPIGPITSVFLVGQGTYRWYDSRFNWRDDTEEFLEGLRTNVVVAELRTS
jgi:hypothetical protein